jgi:hypothetical protein
MTWDARYTEQGATIDFFGLVKGSEILEAKADFFRHAFANPPTYVLCDFSAADRFEVDSPMLEMIIEQDKRATTTTHSHLLEAVVAPTQLQYGLARIWQTRVDAAVPHTGVFRTRPEALEWLRTHGVDQVPLTHLPTR